MIWAYRIVWMVGALALVVEWFLFSHPRYRVPPRFTQKWVSVQTDRYQFEMPQPFRSSSLSDLALGVATARTSLRVLEGISLQHSWRAGMQVMIVSFRTQESGEAEQPLLASTENNPYQMARRAHQEYLEFLRQGTKVQRAQLSRSVVVQINQSQALRTNFTGQIAHRIPNLKADIEGFVMTFPLSAEQSLLFYAYYPQEQAQPYRSVFERVVKSFRIKAS